MRNEVTTIQPTKSDSDEISDDDDDDDGIGENTEDDTSPTEAVFSSKLSETEPGEPDTELSVQPRDDSGAEEGVDSGDSATSDSGESEKEADVGKVVALDDADDDAADDGDESETGDDGEDGDKVVKDEGIIDLEEAEKMFSEEDEEGERQPCLQFCCLLYIHISNALLSRFIFKFFELLNARNRRIL